MMIPAPPDAVHDRCWEVTYHADLDHAPPPVFDELVGCLDAKDWRARYNVISALSKQGVMKRADFMTVVLPAGRKAVERVRLDPENSVRYASGYLSNELQRAESRYTVVPPKPPDPVLRWIGNAQDFVDAVSTIFCFCFFAYFFIFRRIKKPPPEMRGKL
jgi:hypothetical protein